MPDPNQLKEAAESGSDTPETDKEQVWVPFVRYALVPADIARKLERERDMLAERERKCPTMLECEARALLRALQEICDAVGMTDAASPAQIVTRVRELAQNH